MNILMHLCTQSRGSAVNMNGCNLRQSQNFSKLQSCIKIQTPIFIPFLKYESNISAFLKVVCYFSVYVHNLLELR